MLACLFASPRAWAQDAPPWEDAVIEEVVGVGFVHEPKDSTLNLTGLKKSSKITREIKDRAIKELFKTGKFNDVTIDVELIAPGKARVTVAVVEYVKVDSVDFDGVNEIPLNTLKPVLRLAPGEALNPYHLKLDREYIREQYLLKGYYFSSVTETFRPGPSGGVVLVWNVVEGPMVSVEEILFTGNITVDEDDLRRFILSKENSTILWVIPGGKEPFVERNLREDVERIKLYYRLEGWLDIQTGNRVFLEDLIFSEDRTRVTIKIHIDEGRRYRIRNIRFDYDAASRRVFPEAEMREWLISRPGEFYTENNAGKDIQKIRDKYGERAYILAEVNHSEIVALDAQELDLVFSINEKEKVYVGRLLFEGNTKTRDDVLRREFTRTGFLPGEEYNSRSFQRAVQRIKDKGYVEQMGGINWRRQETDDPRTNDVVVDIKEGQTGTVRFAAGYSSNFGVLGLLEFTQRNFDIADLPTSFDDLIGGTGFAGGGQFLRLRIAPAARRQSYSADFREPYVFGYEFGMGVTAYATNTLRESYDDRRVGARLSFDKRLEPFTFQVGLKGERIRIDNVDDDAPPAVRDLDGDNTVFSVTPAIIYDTRDSFIFPTEGFKFTTSYEYAGQILPGDFQFNKLAIEMEGHVTLFETESSLKHVASFAFMFGWVHGARTMEEVPLIERFYAGGRDSIRGFEFRGMGPHELGDPVGGEASVLGTIEYSYPLFVEFLRGAVFYDIANLTEDIYDLADDKWRNTVGFGVRFLIPQLGNIPVKLDFGIPLTRESDDERQSVTFDIGALF